MDNGLLWEQKIIDEIFLKNKGDNIISAVLESCKKKVLIVNTDNEIVYINKKTNFFLANSGYIGKNLFSVLEIDKNYIKKCLLDGCAFSLLKIIIKDKVLYADLAPLVFNSQIIGGLLVLKEKEDSFMKLLNYPTILTRK